MKIKTTKFNCLYKKGKRIYSQFSINGLYSKEKFDLGQFFQRLNTEAGLDNLVNFRMPPKFSKFYQKQNLKLLAKNI